MKETLVNLKKVYKKYGREYKSSLVKIFIFSLFGIVTNICLPLLSAKLIICIYDTMDIGVDLYENI